MKDYAAIAQRNREQRLEQIARLRPVAQDASARCNELRGRRDGVKETRSVHALVERMSYAKGFFPTPAAIVDEVLSAAGGLSGLSVLEPSAGRGNIAEAARAAGAKVHCIELVYDLAEYLRGRGFDVGCRDFLEAPAGPEFDCVLMNPPFDRGEDLKHVQHAFGFLKPGGRLVAVVCSTTGSKLEDWASKRAGYVEPLPAGSFARSERPTGVNTSLLVADKE